MVKVKSLTTDEIRLNEALAEAGITAVETDLAERIVQLAGERPSHLLVPSLHHDRHEIAEVLREALDAPGLPAEPDGPRRGSARAPARGVPPRPRRDLGRELRGRRDRHRLRRRVRGQRPDVHDASPRRSSP